MTIRTIPVARNFAARGIARGRGALLSLGGGNVKAQRMDEAPKDKTREERLAASLRENLKRRKVQTRALTSVARALAEQDAPALPKPDTKS